MPTASIVLRLMMMYLAATGISARIKELAKMIKGITNPVLSDVLFCPINSYSVNRADVIQNLLKHKLEITTTKCSDFAKKFIRLGDPSQLAEDQTRKTIVFVDDFIDSGNTMLNALGGGLLQQRDNPNHTNIVGMLAAY